MNNIGYFAHGYLELDPEARPFDRDFSLEAGCGHEVFSGEYLFLWDAPSTLCPDCIAERFDALPLTEKAELLGSSWIQI